MRVGIELGQKPFTLGKAIDISIDIIPIFPGSDCNTGPSADIEESLRYPESRMLGEG